MAKIDWSEFTPVDAQTGDAVDWSQFTPMPSAKEEPGLLARAKQGLESTVGNVKIAATNDARAIAETVSEGEKTRLPQTAAQIKMAQEIKPLQDEYKNAEGLDAVGVFAKMAAKRLAQFITNPAELTGAVIENLPNSAPGMAGGLAGAATGAATPVPGGALVGGVVGGTAGGYAVEQGAAMRDQILKEAAERKIDPRDPAALEPLIREKYDEFLTKSRLKGIGTAGTDAVLNAVTFGLAGAGERAILRGVNETRAGVRAGTVTAEQGAARLAELQAQQAARSTLGARAARGAGITTAEMAGEGISEAAGQKLAYGEVDALDVIDESVLGLGQGAGMAAGRGLINRAIGQPTEGAVDKALAAGQDDLSRLRQMEAQAGLQSAATAADAAAAANTMAGSVDELTAAVDAYLSPAPIDPITPATATAPTAESAQLEPGQPAETPSLVTAQREMDALGGLPTEGLSPEQILAGVEAKRAAAAQRAQQELGLASAEAPAGTTDFAAKRADAAARAQSEMGDTLPRFRYTPELQGNKAPEANVGAPDLVSAYVQQMRETNTPAARAFVQGFEAGRITPADVQQTIELQNPELRAPAEQQIPSNATPAQPQGLQVETTGARPQMAAPDAVTQFGARPYTQQDLTPEGAADRLAVQKQLAPAQQTEGLQVETGMQPRGAFAGRNEAIRAGNLPRPAKVGGVPTGSLTDEQLRETAGNDTLPAITRRGAQIELMARQQEQRGQQATAALPDAQARLEAAAAQAPAAADQVAARLQNAAAEGRLSQPSGGRIITAGAKLSTQRNVAPGATVAIKDGGTDHNVNVVEAGRLGATGRLLQQVARVFGKRLVAFESDTLQADGFVLDDDNRSIFVNAKTQVSPLAVFGHELTHLLKRDNPQAYAALQAVVERELGEGAMQRFEQEYGAGANLEELTSDLVGNRFQEASFWTDVFNEVAAQNPEGARGVITRLAAAISKAVNAFLKVVRQPGFQADQYVKDVQAVKAAVRQALAQYAQQQREPAMRMEAEQMRAEAQVDLTAGSQAEPVAAQFTAQRQAGERVDNRVMMSTRRAPADSAAAENRMAVVVGAKPGEFNWNFTRSDLPPPPFAAPTQYGPRLEKIGEGVYEILRSNGFKKLAEEAFGIKGLRVAPLHGSWLNKPEPSFALYADGLTFEQADELSKMLGFAFAQDATVVFQPTSEQSPGEIPAVYIGGNKKLTDEQMKAVLTSAQAEGVDYSSTADGKAVRFLHFGDDAGLAELMEKTARIASNVGLGAPKVVYVRSQLNEADSYTKGSGGSAGQAVWFGSGEAGRSNLFRRTVDHVLVPYAKVVGSEGYRFAVSRFGQRFGLSAEQQGLIRQALLPKSGADKSTVDVASGKVKLDIKATGARNKTSVSDILWALQNRSAQAGLIEPGDYSDQARRLIAEAIADEVAHNINDTSSGKSAIGWYDRALKAAKEKYEAIFPELKTDRNRELLFDAVLGITSQGNDVFSNSLFAARIYELTTRQNMTLSQAVAALKGTFGGETVAIENNVLKLEELINRNGYDAMRQFFNKKDTVSKINARLRSDSTLFYKGKPLSVDGAADQRVTGWMVFGPKIGSFINNLHGDYSTLTADLWFSRTWNRILGFSFVHAPAREAEQYQTFISALIGEYSYVKDREGPIQPKRVSKTGKVEMPEFGTDSAELTDAEVEQIIADPDEALRYATELEEVYRKGGYKVKTDLRRAAKNWIENRTEPVALPRADLERDFQQRTVETAQKIIKRRIGQDITIADIQAALWYYEKDNLFKLLGGTNKKSEAADYAGAADETLKAYQAGDLFYAKTDNRYVYGSKGSYLDAPAPSARQRDPQDIPLDQLAGRKVSMQVRVEETGETATITMDAKAAIEDANDREATMRRLLECLG